jgi:RNA polymerase sigma-70 factor (ECF subfamily)
VTAGDRADQRDERARWIRSALDRHEAALVAYAARIVGDAHAARDVVQEAFLRLCREDRTKVESRLAPWLYTVCRRLAIDERRRAHRAAPTDGAALDGRGTTSPPAEPSAEAAADVRESAASALHAIAALPERQQEVLLLKFRHGLTYREISDVTGLGSSHVGVLIHEGMTALRRRFRPAAEPAPAVRQGGVR